ncbi:MAG: magnesium chelatase subunit H, partial [Gammaproteobacteria bacterium]
MPRRTSVTEQPVRVVIVTLDAHLASAAEAAHRALARDLPGLHLSLHAAAEWAGDETALARCRDDIARGDIILVTMLFLDEHIRAVLPDLEARRAACDALVCCMSAGEVLRLTRMGRFDMTRKESGAMAWLKRLRGTARNRQSSGAAQMAMLKRLPRLLRFVPGTAQDVRAYFLAMQYWLACSDANLENLVRELVNRYASGARAALRGTLKVAPPVEYPDNGVYHPRLRGGIAASAARLPRRRDAAGTVGLLVMRSYVLAGNTAHYDGVIAALEARGLDVVPVFACGLDMRPAIEAFFLDGDTPRVDAVVSLTGFSLVGGPAYNDADAAAEILARLDVPYLAAQAIEFQSLEQWEASERGLLPLEATMMVAIPEIDGATGPLVFGGRAAAAEARGSRDMQAHPERADMLSRRVARLVALRRKARASRRVAIVLFNFPPNSGAVGSAAYLDVFTSLLNTLRAMAAAGYTVGELPTDADALRARIVEGNAVRNGADANVCARIAVDDYVRRETWLADIEAQWGPAPGRHQADGDAIRVLGERFGNVLVGIQPAFGYEGDPMRLLFHGSFAPTHAFAAFYRYLREDFAADACLHFGTHGALEFMPGKQVGLSAACWPDRLIADLPNIYFYAANNPSEGALARRRSAATLVSYMTPPLTHAGVYRGLGVLKASLARWHESAAAADPEQLELIASQAAAVELAPRAAHEDATAWIARLATQIQEIESTLIPCGLHVAGEALSDDARAELLEAINACAEAPLPQATIAALAGGRTAAASLAAGGLASDDA